MPIPELAVTAADPREVDADVLVLGVRPEDGTAALVLPDGTTAADLGLADLDLVAIGAGAGDGELTRLPASGIAARSLALVGLGAAAGTDALRSAAGTAARRIRGKTSLAFALPVEDGEQAGAVLEGAALGAYDFSAYRSEPSPAKAGAERVLLVTGREVAEEVVQRASVAADAVRLVKDLVNTPPLDLYPESLAEIAEREAEAAGVSARTWDEAALAADGFGGILGVGSGSTRPPRLVRVGWAPEGATGSLALVGKGITFDSGGLSLKPPASMIGMKYDMTGAATVLSVVVAAARLRLPVAVTGWLCLAENLPSGSAIRPNDVLRIRGGRTVEVLNTDAEGRLVLADGLTAASEEQPDALLDVATLTGAASVALGNRYVGAMGDEELIGEVRTAAAATGEHVWHMPLPEEMRALLNSEIADLANVKPGSTAGGMLIAGRFLQEFVGRTADGSGRIPWVHLDIASAANNAGSAYGHTGTGPTGVVVRTLLALLQARATGAGRASGSR
jgi:leucyl aminopeptidase